MVEVLLPRTDSRVEDTWHVSALNHVYLQFDRDASTFGGYLLTESINDPQR